MVAMASSGPAKVTLPTDEQILVTRRLAAPRHLVYRAWTAPELVKQWRSGGHGTVAVAEIDPRVGGRWRYVIVADGGFEVAFHGEYRELVPNERIVTTEVYAMPGAPALPEADEPLNIVTFTELRAHPAHSHATPRSSRWLVLGRYCR